MTSVTVSEQYPSRSTVLDVGSVIDSKGVGPVVGLFISDSILVHLCQHRAKNTEDSAKCQQGIFFNLNAIHTALLVFSKESILKEWVLDALLY